MKYSVPLMIFLLPVTIMSQANFYLKPDLTNRSYSIPISFELNPLDNFRIVQKSELFTVDHPFDHYIWYSYKRGDMTFINEYSYFDFSNKSLRIKIGRDYIPVGFGKLSGLFISPVAPALDNASFTISGFKGVYFSNYVIRLDNREAYWYNEEEVAQRWHYLRTIGYQFKNLFRVDFFDAVISTGFNRGLEWYYLNPLASLFMERKHEYHWIEGGDSTSEIGIGDNDNHFVGGDWKLFMKKWSIYGEWLIDEWQLTPEDRTHMQTVFGFLLGIEYNSDKWSANMEYSYASPWLYLSRGLYASLEKHYQPLGLRSPQSHSLDILYKYDFNDSKSIIVQTHFEERGDQSFHTVWNAWDNKIDNFQFTQTLPGEVKILYKNSKGKYFKRVGVYHNWFQSGLTQFIIGWDFGFDLD